MGGGVGLVLCCDIVVVFEVVFFVFFEVKLGLVLVVISLYVIVKMGVL